MSSVRHQNRRLTRARARNPTTTPEADQPGFAGLDESNPHENEGGICEIQTYEQRYNSRGEPVLLHSGRRSELGWEEQRSLEAALVLTRFYSLTRDLQSTQLEIQSPFIKAALKEVVRSYPGVNLDSNGHIYIFGEPHCLFHYRRELENYASKLRHKKARDHVNLCIQYMARILRKEIASYENTMQDDDVLPGLEFETLWMAFRPGVLLYQRLGDVDIICHFREMVKEREKPHTAPYWRVYAQILACTGRDFEYIHHKVNISHFDGYKPLHELEIFPLDYHREKDSIRAKTLERGRKYVSLVGIHHCTYDGLADILPQPTDFRKYTQPNMFRGRVIVDSQEFNENSRREVFDRVPDRQVIHMNADDPIELCDDDLLICQHQMPGFSLAKKNWALFDVSKLSPVDYNKDAYASLVLPLDMKKTLFSLVRLQKEDSSQFDDLVIGKGKGLIILLHGPPGVGKTFTAESIADYAHRPLYTLEGTDFVHGYFNPEKDLANVLARASRWNAVVLMDEADVFMQERGMTEYSRNEQVSVLLRTLEYFEGIIFLTTNRVQTIDTAFKSRIHLSLTYPAFSPEARSGLWKTFILKAMDQRHPRWLSTKLLDRISKEEVNGREIKNVIRVAHALAVSDERPMEANDILQGLRSLKDFERDFKKAAGKRQLDDDQDAVSSKKSKVDHCNPSN